jgi:hypothetical protein
MSSQILKINFLSMVAICASLFIAGHLEAMQDEGKEDSSSKKIGEKIGKALRKTKDVVSDVKEGIKEGEKGKVMIQLKWKKGTAQEYKENNGTLTITTDNNANATYQAETQREKVTPGQKFTIPYEITVEKDGKISFGVLNTQRNSWIDKEVILLTPGLHKGIKEVIIPQGETEISLVLRNYHLTSNGGAGQSKFTAKLGLEKEEKK